MMIGCDAIIISDPNKSRHSHSEFLIYTATTRVGANSLFFSHVRKLLIRVFHAIGYDPNRKSNAYRYDGLYLVNYVTQLDQKIKGERYVSHVNTYSLKTRHCHKNQWLTKGELFCFYLMPHDIEYHQRNVAFWTKCTA
jgi:hypothetical protein